MRGRDLVPHESASSEQTQKLERPQLDFFRSIFNDDSPTDGAHEANAASRKQPDVSPTASTEDDSSDLEACPAENEIVIDKKANRQQTRSEEEDEAGKMKLHYEDESESEVNPRLAPTSLERREWKYGAHWDASKKTLKKKKKKEKKGKRKGKGKEIVKKF